MYIGSSLTRDRRIGTRLVTLTLNKGHLRIFWPDNKSVIHLTGDHSWHQIHTRLPHQMMEIKQIQQLPPKSSFDVGKCTISHWPKWRKFFFHKFPPVSVLPRNYTVTITSSLTLGTLVSRRSKSRRTLYSRGWTNNINGFTPNHRKPSLGRTEVSSLVLSPRCAISFLLPHVRHRSSDIKII